MKIHTRFIWIMLLMSLPFITHAQLLTDNLLFTSRLDAKNLTIPGDTSASGVVAISVNSTQDSMCLNLSLAGITDTVTAIGIYQGPLGLYGIQVVDLLPSLKNNHSVQTSLTTPFVSSETIAGFLNGDFSIYVFTNNNADAAIGGHIMLERDYSFYAVMDSSQEVPATGSQAYGLAVFKVSMDQSKMRINMIVKGLSGPLTGAHIHFGNPGVAGPVAVDLTADVNENQIDVTIDSSLFLLALDSMIHGNAYINVHTGIYPNGEIRGQIKLDKGIAFHSQLSGGDEVPPVNTDATGLAHASFNSTMDSLSYQVIADGLSGPITGAHFHLGAIGADGPVIVGLSDNDTSNAFLLTGSIDSTLISDTLMRNMLQGSVYVNVHTDLNPDGEIRGQVARYNWEGFTYTMDGDDEIPAVFTAADGSGYASINPEATSLHFMLAASGLSGPATGAHFHQGTVGEEGPVIFSLVPYLVQITDSTVSENDVFAAGFWDDQSNPALTSDDVFLFLSDDVYANIHTDFAPNGEIRGQVHQGADCFELNTGITGVYEQPLYSLEVFPNPATDNTTAVIEVSKSCNATIQLYDLSGKIIRMQHLSLTPGTYQQVIDLKNNAPGIYFLSVQAGDRFLIAKIEKQ